MFSKLAGLFTQRHKGDHNQVTLPDEPRAFNGAEPVIVHTPTSTVLDLTAPDIDDDVDPFTAEDATPTGLDLEIPHNNGTGDSSAEVGDDPCLSSSGASKLTSGPSSVKTVCESSTVFVGATFDSLQSARLECTQYAQCPLKQSSTRKQKYIQFACFRAGHYIQKESVVPEASQRKKSSVKCNCPFLIKLLQVSQSDSYTIYSISNTHNHELFDKAEMQGLSQNRFIPADVQEKIIALNELGILKCSQIMNLIEKDYFPEVMVTWTSRDVQNLLQKTVDRQAEANDFLKLLNVKANEGWIVRMDHNDETFRLQRVFWMSKTGEDKYSQFHDVLEIDATYKTNR